MADYSGVWVLESTENMEPFVAAEGMPWAMRKVANTMGWGVGKHKVTIQMAPGGDEMKVHEVTPMFERSYVIHINGTPEEQMVGKSNKGMMVSVWEGQAVKHTVTKDNGKVTTATRTMAGDKMDVELTLDGITAKRHFKKQ
eukprot:CAMPEP_0206232406 /NCGR_PEP_ID=MMETSP0047_2-20121206/11395_1 /ASSEMBLY_ACC=CAM_ASM_000192 /TAXON_ID=195065 /ORGANISM="Chroomonas mesostigmatica_cf, Strain CCMP1168" /LENGTH=140 /DNA_ID=CAMNT_0053656133 /DNA_START=33 /DNA_END=455 /DNA_ORIENTATION=-